MQPLRRLLGMVRPYARFISLGLLAMVLSTPANLVSPLIWKYVVDQVIVANHPERLAPALAAMLGIHLVGASFSGLRTWWLGIGTQQLAVDLRNQLYDQLQGHSVGFFHDRRSGDLIARCVGDVDVVQDVLGQLAEVLNSALQFVLVAVILLYLHPVVGLLTLLPMPLVFGLNALFNSRIRDLYRSIRDRLGDVSAKLQENLTGILVIKAFAREPDEARRFQAETRQYYTESLRGVAARSVFFPLVWTAGFLSSLTMLAGGAYYARHGLFTVGALTAYSRYWWLLFQPVYTLATTNEMLQRANAAASRIFELLDTPQEIVDAPDAVELSHVDGHLELDQVTFAYPTRESTLEDVGLRLAAGSALGVVGPSGAGKSTLLYLLLRFYDPQAGRILLDGHDLRELTQRSLRQHFAVVTQEPFLFNASVRHNIAYGRPEADEEALFEAARRANAHDFISALPDGYETLVGERGVKLSGGQKQRICIARAFLADPRVLLLDEATAAVEPESEAIIQAALEALMAGRTSVVISHRLSMVRACDPIVVLNGGRLIEQGSHEQLLAAEGWYARMYRLQMGHEAPDPAL